MAQYRPGGLYVTPVIRNIIILNVIVFILQNIFKVSGQNLEQYGALWSPYTGNFKVWQLVTHLFMHGNVPHIAFNMFALYLFGVELESIWGSKRFLEFYMICGISAGIAQMLLPGGLYSIGASGAIMGVMAAFAYLFPNRPTGFMFLPFVIPAKYLISGLVLMDLFSGISASPDGIGHFAHLGGALAGFIIVIFWNRTNRKNFY